MSDFTGAPTLAANLATVSGDAIKKSSPLLSLIIAAIAFSMYIVGFVIDNKCVKKKGYKETHRAMKWVLALGLCSLITMLLTILIASTGKNTGTLLSNIDPKLAQAAAIVTFICTMVGSSYGIWASLKCEDRLRKTRLGFHIVSIVAALIGVMVSSGAAKKAYGYTGTKLGSARAYVAAQKAAARAYAAQTREALAAKAENIRQAAAREPLVTQV